jgi:hypothetical protein
MWSGLLLTIGAKRDGFHAEFARIYAAPQYRNAKSDADLAAEWYIIKKIEAFTIYNL